jgi:cyclophilin family peptidyl-prolyl cis-trans isomerase
MVMKKRIFLSTAVFFCVFCADFVFAQFDPNSADPNDVIVIKTSMGDIEVALASDELPITVNNIKDYIEHDFYDGLVFHRAEDWVVQGGGFDSELNHIETADPIVHEGPNSLSNVRGTTAMARTSEVDSATSQFYFNVKDNSSFLDYTDSESPGYVAFGVVRKGMEVIDAMAGLQTHNAQSSIGMLQNVPVELPVIYDVDYKHEIGYCHFYVEEDYNHDCRVNLMDFVELSARWLEGQSMYGGLLESFSYIWDGGYALTDEPSDIVLSDDGYVYVFGLSDNADDNKDYVVLKFSVEGALESEMRFDGPGNGLDIAVGGGADSDGNVYAGGFVTDQSRDYCVVKFDGEGNKVWERFYDGAAGSIDSAEDVRVTTSGEVYITGSSYGTNGYDFATVKYDTSGSELWAKIYNGAANSSDYAAGVAVDGEDNCYVAGRSTTGTGYDFAVVKYDIDGNEVWAETFDGDAHKDDEAKALAADGDGSVIVTGFSESSSGQDYLTVKYLSDGRGSWYKVYDGADGKNDVAVSCAVDDHNDVYVTGYSFSSGNSADILTIKYSSGGAMLWERRYNGDANGIDTAKDIVVKDGYVYVAGRSRGMDGDYDGVVIKYDLEGNELAVMLHPGGDVGDEDVIGLSVDDLGNLFTVMETETADGADDIALVKYEAVEECADSTLKGDYDNNCVVDISDAAEYLQVWLECNLEPSSICEL